MAKYGAIPTCPECGHEILETADIDTRQPQTVVTCKIETAYLYTTWL